MFYPLFQSQRLWKLVEIDLRLNAPTSFFILIRTNTSHIFGSSLVLCSCKRLSSCTPYTKREKEAESQNPSSFMVHRTPITSTQVAYIVGPAPITILMVDRWWPTHDPVGTIDQAYLVTASPLDEMLNFVNSSFSGCWIFWISYLFCPVGWGCRIHRLQLCRGVRPHQKMSVLKIWH